MAAAEHTSCQCILLPWQRPPFVPYHQCWWHKGEFTTTLSAVKHYNATFAMLGVPVWLSGNMLDLINVVTVRQLVPGWMTILWWANHLGTELGTQVDWAWAIPPLVGNDEYRLWLRPLLGKNSESCVTVGPVTRTAGILAYSRSKALAVNGAGCRMLYASSIGANFHQWYKVILTKNCSYQLP